MQFTGHSLPVHQSMTVPWDFNLVPYCQPISPTPMEYATFASLEWHVWPGRRSIYNRKGYTSVVLYSCNTNTRGNIIKDNDERNTLLYKSISLILFSKRAHCLLLVERSMERHILRERTSSHIFFQESVGANACTPLQVETLWFSELCLKWPRGSHHVVSFRLHTCSTWVPWLCCPVY